MSKFGFSPLRFTRSPCQEQRGCLPSVGLKNQPEVRLHSLQRVCSQSQGAQSSETAQRHGFDLCLQDLEKTEAESARAQDVV